MVRKGFTIVELLIVIVVIGILATLVIVGYKGAEQKAYDSSLQADLKDMGDQFDIFRTKSGALDQYPKTTTDLATLELKASKSAYITSIPANAIVCVSSDGKSFAIVSQSKSGNIFMTTQNGFSAYTQAASTFTASGTCPALGLNYVTSGWSSGAWSSWLGG
jgi:general secretion pathway protein G